LLGYELDDLEFKSDGGRGESFFSPLRPNRLWGPTSILFNGHQRLFSWG